MDYQPNPIGIASPIVQQGQNGCCYILQGQRGSWRSPLGKEYSFTCPCQTPAAPTCLLQSVPLDVSSFNSLKIFHSVGGYIYLFKLEGS